MMRQKKQLAKPRFKFAEIVTGAEAGGIDHEVDLDEIGNQPPTCSSSRSTNSPEAQILQKQMLELAL